jgi:Flp pilus assembly pilin Flp
MLHLLQIFLHDETAQDLIEYTLMIAFVALASAALFLGAGFSINGIWDEGNEVLSSANKAGS